MSFGDRRGSTKKTSRRDPKTWEISTEDIQQKIEILAGAAEVGSKIGRSFTCQKLKHTHSKSTHSSIPSPHTHTHGRTHHTPNNEHTQINMNQKSTRKSVWPHSVCPKSVWPFLATQDFAQVRRRRWPESDWPGLCRSFATCLLIEIEVSWNLDSLCDIIEWSITTQACLEDRKAQGFSFGCDKQEFARHQRSNKFLVIDVRDRVPNMQMVTMMILRITQMSSWISCKYRSVGQTAR